MARQILRKRVVGVSSAFGRLQIDVDKSAQARRIMRCGLVERAEAMLYAPDNDYRLPCLCDPLRRA